MSWQTQADGDSAIEHTAMAGPRIVQFADKRDGSYVVRDLQDGQIVSVPKRYSEVDAFPHRPTSAGRGALLLTLSTYAVVGAFLGGVGGVLLGALVVFFALIQLGRFGGRVRRWRRRWRNQRSDERELLPAVASSERLRLLGALGQGGLAALIGAGVCALLLPHVLHYLPR
jgi:hypothetical protein